MTQAKQFVQYFKTLPEWGTMVNTVENSPWHREENVAVHTEMCIEQYMTRFAAKRSDYQNLLAIIALLFHDTGKPTAEEVVESETRGTYRRYSGHEQDSAVCFTEFWLKDKFLQSFVTVDDARKIRWMIEHHLPYGLKDSKKRSDLRTANAHIMREDEQTFYDCLRSDAAGRISDDHETKLQHVEDWIDAFRAVPLTINKVDTGMGKCFIMIGPSGSGKSTWTKQYIRAGDKVLSMDDWRRDYFMSMVGIGFSNPDPKDLYRDVWQFCVDNEKDFKAYMQQRMADAFRDIRISKGDVYVDNTNGSKKARAQYVQHARNIGMRVIAVEFWNSFETLTNRQHTRTDKLVPASSVKQQYFAQTCAWNGSEVDEVIVVPGS